MNLHNIINLIVSQSSSTAQHIHCYYGVLFMACTTVITACRIVVTVLFTPSVSWSCKLTKTGQALWENSIVALKFRAWKQNLWEVAWKFRNYHSY